MKAAHIVSNAFAPLTLRDGEHAKRRGINGARLSDQTASKMMAIGLIFVLA
jgi:hypothetical protein